MRDWKTYGIVILLLLLLTEIACLGEYPVVTRADVLEVTAPAAPPPSGPHILTAAKTHSHGWHFPLFPAPHNFSIPDKPRPPRRPAAALYAIPYKNRVSSTGTTFMSGHSFSLLPGVVYI